MAESHPTAGPGSQTSGQTGTPGCIQRDDSPLYQLLRGRAMTATYLKADEFGRVLAVWPRQAK